MMIKFDETFFDIADFSPEKSITGYAHFQNLQYCNYSFYMKDEEIIIYSELISKKLLSVLRAFHFTKYTKGVNYTEDVFGLNKTVSEVDSSSEKGEFLFSINHNTIKNLLKKKRSVTVNIGIDEIRFNDVFLERDKEKNHFRINEEKNISSIINLPSDTLKLLVATKILKKDFIVKNLYDFKGKLEIENGDHPLAIKMIEDIKKLKFIEGLKDE